VPCPGIQGQKPGSFDLEYNSLQIPKTPKRDKVRNGGYYIRRNFSQCISFGIIIVKLRVGWGQRCSMDGEIFIHNFGVKTSVWKILGSYNSGYKEFYLLG
jgi:hypothetical protein